MDDEAKDKAAAEKMKEFRDAIAEYDSERIEDLIHEANRIKKILR